MKSLLLRSAIAFAGLVALLIAWVAGARPMSLALDRVHTAPLESRPVTQLGLDELDHGILRIDDQPMSLTGPDDRPFAVRMTVEQSGHLLVQAAGRAITLDEIDSSGKTLLPRPRDHARFQIDRSMLSWPTPLELNFMTGQSPSWKRHLYYRLIWEKPDGTRLEMIWRYEQFYYDDWASGFMVRPGTTGLIRVDIRP